MKELGITVGDTVETATLQGIFTVQPEQKITIDPQILQWGQEFIDKNRELLKRLKNK
jgi:ribosome biogenesis protein Tsr3